MAEDVLVIGAGAAGIISARALEKAGISYRVVDRADRVGSTWASVYPSLRLNTVSFVSHLPGTRLPLHWGVYPTGRQFHQHLSDYVGRHDFNIHLGVEVTRVAPENGGWRVESSEGSAWYPAVIIASGKFSNPYIPPIPGLDSFQGRWLHARDFRDPAPFAGRRVMVVGGGPSGADIAVALAPVAAPPVWLSIRSDILIARRFPLGLPDGVWKILTGLLPARIGKPLFQYLSWRSYRGLAELGYRNGRNREDRLGTSAPVRGRELVDATRAGRVRPVAGLARLSGRCAELVDGSRHEIDTLILATGYRPALGYLEIAYDTDRDGWPLRDLSADPEGMEVLGYPGLYLVGRFYQGYGPLFNMRSEAETAVRQIAARLAALRGHPAAVPHR